MAVEVASAYVTLLPSARGFQSRLQREISGPAAVEGQRAGTVAGSRFSSGFSRTIGNAGRRMFAPLARAARYGITALGGLTVAGVAFGLKTAASLEQAKVGFTTMLGSAKEASAFLARLRQFAATTPFEFPDVVRASQRLLAMGFRAKRVLPTLTAIGDAAAGLGLGAEGIDRITTAIGQIQAKGRVQSEELLQLTESGIPALKILANGYGKTTLQMQKMVTKGIVPSKKAIPLLLRGIEEGTKDTAKFGGLMEKQSKTLSGLWSTFKDTVATGLANAVQPLLPILERVLPSAMTTLGSAFDKVGRGASVFIRVLRGSEGPVNGWRGSVADFARILRDQVMPTLGDFAENAGRLIRAAAPALKDIGKLAGGVLLGGIKALSRVMGFLADHTSVVKGALAGIAGLVVGKKLKSLFGGGRGAAGGLLNRGSSITSPMYVWVVNGGAGGGGPVPIGGGKGGRVGRFARGLTRGAGALFWGNLLAEVVGPKVGSGGASKAFSLGQAYGLTRDLKAIAGEYEFLNNRQRRALDRIDFRGAIGAGQRGDLDAMRRVIAEANAAIKRFATTDKDRERVLQRLLLRKQGFSKEEIRSTIRGFGRGAERREAAIADARLTKLERLSAYPDPMSRRPSQATQTGRSGLTGNGAFTILVRGDLNVNNGNAKDFVAAASGRHRQRALSGSTSSSTVYVPHGA